MTLERREAALLALVERDRAAQCDAILSDANGRAAALLGEAHAEALARMREVFAEERRRAHEILAAAHAKLSTRQRLHDQQRTAALLALGMAAAARRTARALAGRRAAPPLDRCDRGLGAEGAAAQAMAHRAWPRLAGGRAASARRSPCAGTRRDTVMRRGCRHRRRTAHRRGRQRDRRHARRPGRGSRPHRRATAATNGESEPSAGPTQEGSVPLGGTARSAREHL